MSDDRKALATNLRIRILELEGEIAGLQAEANELGAELRKILQPQLSAVVTVSPVHGVADEQ
jgi:hypothetical protein